MLAVLYLIGTVLGGIGLGWIATHPGRQPLSPAEEHAVRNYARVNKAEFRDASIEGKDGAVLHAWFLRPAEWNGNAVVLLHGVSDNRLGMYGYGRWLLEKHYSVLLADARAHGMSGGQIATYVVGRSGQAPRHTKARPH